MRIAINGLGRVGRALLRQAVLSEDLEVVAVNDLADPHTLAALLRRDTTYGPFPVSVEAGDDCLVIDGRKVPWSSASTPTELPWASYAVDVAVECTGKFRTGDTAGGHLEAGARKVVISAPGKGVDATFVYKVNHEDYNPETHEVVSNASCTTNCIIPMVKVIQDNFGIASGYMTTVHAYTNDQSLLDAAHKDPRRARSAPNNIVPTSTGAARTAGVIYPELQGKVDGMSMRVPVADGSITDFVARISNEASADDVNAAFQSAADGELSDILEYAEAPLVSSDIVGNKASCVFDSQLTMSNGGTVKVLGWYDNEWGYSNRTCDLAAYMGEKL